MNRWIVAMMVCDLLLLGCSSGEACRHMAFTEIDHATRMDVKSNGGTTLLRQITDPDQLSALLQFMRTRSSDWYAPWYDTPVGQIGVEVFNGDTFVGDFNAGKHFFEAQGCGYFYMRDGSAKETQEFVKLLGVGFEFK